MRKRIWIICVVLWPCAVLFLLRRSRQQHQKTKCPKCEAPTNQPEPAGTAKKWKRLKVPAFQTAAVSSAAATTQTGRNQFQQRALADWQRPIEFYGRVVDENTNPVAGANITFGWSEQPKQEAARKATTQSDAAGLFSLHGEHAAGLDVWVGKEDYYASQRGTMGIYLCLTARISHLTLLNPVIFNLRKKGKGESLIKTDYPNWFWAHSPTSPRWNAGGT